jgi:hypothetical protein
LEIRAGCTPLLFENQIEDAARRIPLSESLSKTASNLNYALSIPRIFVLVKEIKGRLLLKKYK